MRRIAFAGALFLAAIPDAYSQTLGLPHVDGITVFYRGGELADSSGLRASPTAPCHGSSFPLCGWGFETVYDLTKGSSPWGALLAVGYDFLSIRATVGANNAYQLLGSVQTLPSFTLYGSRDVGTKAGVYFGLGSGLVVLKNVRAYNASGQIFSIDGETWGFTPSLGAYYSVRKADERGPGGSFFVEVAYEVRDFPSLNYSLPSGMDKLPADLPRSLSPSGPVLNVGFELDFGKEKKNHIDFSVLKRLNSAITLGNGLKSIDLCKAIPQQYIEHVMRRKLVAGPQPFQYNDDSGSSGCRYEGKKGAGGKAHFGYVVLTPLEVYTTQRPVEKVKVEGFGQEAYFNNGVEARQLWVKVNDQTALVVAFGDEPNEDGAKAIAGLVLRAIR